MVGNLPSIASVAMKLTSTAVLPTTLMLVVWGMRSWHGSIFPAEPLVPILILRRPAVQKERLDEWYGFSAVQYQPFGLHQT